MVTVVIAPKNLRQWFGMSTGTLFRYASLFLFTVIKTLVGPWPPQIDHPPPSSETHHHSSTRHRVRGGSSFVPFS